MEKYNVNIAEGHWGDRDEWQCGHNRGIDCRFLGGSGLPPTVSDNLEIFERNDFTALHYNSINLLYLNTHNF